MHVFAIGNGAAFPGFRLDQDLVTGFAQSDDTARNQSHPGFVVAPLVACGLVNAFILFRAWRNREENLSSSQSETNACVASGLMTLAWVLGMLVVSFMPFIVDIKAVAPNAT